MSTKIYDGLRIHTDDVFSFTNKLHTTMMEVFYTASQKLIMEECQRSADQMTGPVKFAIIAEAEKRWKDEQQKMSTRSTFHDPLRFSLVFGKSASGQLLAYPFYGENDYLYALREMEEVEEYGYWNNTDPEEGITEEEWDFRRKEWDSLTELGEGSFGHLPLYQLPGTMSPFNEMYYELAGQESKFIDTMISFQSTPEQRLQDAFTQACLTASKLDPESFFGTLRRIREAMEGFTVEDMGTVPEKITAEFLRGTERTNFNLNQDTVEKVLDKVRKSRSEE